MPNYYPIMLDVRGRSAIVIGGDRVAAEKAINLSAAGAQVVVISPTFCPELLALQNTHNNVTLREKSYAHGDLAGAFVVVSATTSDPDLSERVWQETQERGQLVNIVDVPARCNFILPSILRRGQLTISVSTEGASPALAKRIRQQLEGTFPPAYGRYLQLAGLIRNYCKHYGLSYEARDAFFGAFFEETNILELLVQNNEEEAFASTVRLLREYDIDLSVTTLISDLKEASGQHGNIHNTQQ